MTSRSVQTGLIERLAELLGPDGIELNADQLRYFAEDALRGRGGPPEAETPLAVVRPATGDETARVLALANAARIPVVPYGAGTGLMGGARSYRPGLVLDTVRLNAIDVNADDRIVWAGAGAILQDVDAALRRHDLCLGHDPWTFPVATVGGTLSTNSLGYKGGRYGGMADHAIALEVALADGTLIKTRAVRRHSAGPNLTRLFIGAEGTLGVITAAALHGHAVPEREELRAFNFAAFEQGFAAVDAMARLGLRPSLLEYGEEHASPWPDQASRDEERRCSISASKASAKRSMRPSRAPWRLSPPTAASSCRGRRRNRSGIGGTLSLSASRAAAPAIVAWAATRTSPSTTSTWPCRLRGC